MWVMVVCTHTCDGMYNTHHAHARKHTHTHTHTHAYAYAHARICIPHADVRMHMLVRLCAGLRAFVSGTDATMCISLLTLVLATPSSRSRYPIAPRTLRGSDDAL
eukprot:Tamp_39854.p1 GENE.Tamp_39854~~Tamp_39854.p1  ORF type:complete len:105 (-),score=4.67 Tamp_39854:49-363(-)